MARRYFPAFVTQDDDASATAGYGVVFPDLPGCVSGGDTLQEAADMAAEALSLHVEGMVEDGLPLPPASDPGHVPGWLRGLPGRLVATLLVPYDLQEAPADVSLDSGLLRQVDEAAAAQGETRAGFIMRAAHERLQRLQVA
jgi:predicted RNase H-like HicB family nuclease